MFERRLRVRIASSCIETTYSIKNVGVCLNVLDIQGVVEGGHGVLEMFRAVFQLIFRSVAGSPRLAGARATTAALTQGLGALCRWLRLLRWR